MSKNKKVTNTQITNPLTGRVLKVRLSWTPSKARQKRPAWALRVNGQKPVFYSDKQQAENAQAQIIDAHMAGGAVTKSETGTLYAAVELFKQTQTRRYEDGNICFVHSEKIIADAESWFGRKEKVVKAEYAKLSPHARVCRRNGYYEKVDGKFVHRHVANVLDGIEIGKLNCSDITKRDVKKWLVFFEQLSVKTQRDKLTALIGVFEAAVEAGWAQFNPARGIKLEDGSYNTTEEEVETGPIEKLPIDMVRKIIETARTQEAVIGNTPWCDSLALSFLAQTGLRFGELAALKWKFVDFKKKRVFVRAAVRKDKNGIAVGGPKNSGSNRRRTPKSRRSVFLTNELVAELKEWKLRSPKSGDDDRVFLSHRLKMHSSSHHLLLTVLRPACDAAGVRRIVLHQLRHFFASLCVDRYGDNWEKIADLLGHETTATTRRNYAHWIDNVERDNLEGEAFSEAMWG